MEFCLLLVAKECPTFNTQSRNSNISDIPIGNNSVSSQFVQRTAIDSSDLTMIVRIIDCRSKDACFNTYESSLSARNIIIYHNFMLPENTKVIIYKNQIRDQQCEFR